MMTGLSFTKERLLPFYARINETGVSRVLTFTNEDGTAHDISSYNFKLIVKLRPSTTTNLFTITIGSGLTVQGAGSNELLIELSQTNLTRNVDTNFWTLFSIAENKTWLDGPFFFHNGEFDGVDETDSIVIGATSDVTITVSSDYQAALDNGTYSTTLTFDQDKDIYHDATGESITFTLGTGNVNGKGIFLRLNKPTAVTLPATFEPSSSSTALDATKLNVYLLIFFTNWNGSGTDRVIYTNQTFTAI